MPRLTMKKVNEVIRERVDPLLTLYKGNGYYYFIHEKLNMYDSSVYVCRLNHADLEDWVEYAREVVHEDNLK
jgi:hypothetical protein